MGGNALNQLGLNPTRLPAPQFHALAKSVVGRFSLRFPGVRIEPIPAYASKADFGDLDVMVAREGFVQAGGVEALEEWCQEVGFSRGQIRNGPVTSVEWRSSSEQSEGFQVDFITTPEAEFDSAMHYYSFNDLGNLIGRLAHKMGLLHGHQGLLFPMRDDTHEFDRLLVCKDPDRTLSFLGYDPERFKQGFDDLEQIFEYVVSSPYFNKEIFLLENRNHASRTRDKKRKTYRDFLVWIADRDDLPAFDFPEEKSEWLPHIFASFPGFEEQYRQSWERLERHRRVQSQFNGKVVGEMTGLSGKELGQVMKQVRHQLGPQKLESVLEAGGVEALRPAIEEIAASVRRSPRPGR